MQLLYQLIYRPQETPGVLSSSNYMKSVLSATAVDSAQPGLAVVQVDDGKRWLRFSEPVEVIRALDAGEVRECLEAVSSAVERQRLHAAGFIAYEAAPAFDAAMPGRSTGDLPLLWFGLYRVAEEVRPETVFPPAWDHANAPTLRWQPGIGREAYDASVHAIKDAIASGDTYQVNFTFPLHARFDGDPQALFERMVRTQRCRYAAYIDTGQHVVCSASPELFWQLDGERLHSLPMKGTAARGRTLGEDETQREWLRTSLKNQAENVMIVDMVRNDMGRIARYGTVHVPALFEIERYPTVWQMISRVACETDASIREIMAALFPCASITGAPKVRTMEIINDLETQPRGVYTGCIGVLSPDRQGQFNVAIRTVVVDRKRRTATYGVGGGVVWDSLTEAEYDEALLKAQVLTRPRPAFELLETLRWTPDEGYYLLERHLQRLAESAAYFDVMVDKENAAAQLAALAATLGGSPQRVRLLAAQSGTLRCEASPLTWPVEARELRIGLSQTPVDSSDPFLFHKTTHRAVYEQARRQRPDCDDVLLWNEHGELTESTIANVVVERDGELVTPPLDSGLLAGTLRAELLAQGVIREAPLAASDLHPGQWVWLINSVRGWRIGRLC